MLETAVDRIVERQDGQALPDGTDDHPVGAVLGERGLRAVQVVGGVVQALAWSSELGFVAVVRRIVARVCS